MPSPGVTTAVVHIDIWGLGGIEPSQNHSTDDPLDSTSKGWRQLPEWAQTLGMYDLRVQFRL